MRRFVVDAANKAPASASFCRPAAALHRVWWRPSLAAREAGPAGPASWTRPLGPGLRGFAGLGNSSERPKTEMEVAVEEQRRVLFPGQVYMEEARKMQDASLLAAAASPPKDWSPTQLPYRTFDKLDAAAASDDDEDEDDEDDDEDEVGGVVASAAVTNDPLHAGSADDEDIDLVVGMGPPEEVGFRYSGPEPTFFGDWAHKGRVSDF